MKLLTILLSGSVLLTLCLPLVAADQPAAINALLGYKPTDKLLIINGDDAGMCYSANLAVIGALEQGVLTGATIMTPCPWFPHIAEYAVKHPDRDFGVHLTLNAEWGSYRWGPVAGRSAVPKLCDPQGYLWDDVAPLYQHGSPEEAYVEAKAQVERALAAGIDITHLDSHMGSLQYSEPYFQVYLRLAKEYDLPLREASQELLERMAGGHRRAQERAAGILAPDYLMHGMRKEGEPVEVYWKRILRQEIKPGCTELYIHPNLPSDEIKAITGSWQDRAKEYNLFTNDQEVRQILRDQGIILVKYRQLRDAQRKLRKTSA